MVATAKTMLEKYAQVISVELMEALKEAAQARGVSLDVEIALRLMVYMAESELKERDSLFKTIMQQKFTEEIAIAECKRNRQSSHYLYEIEKLRLYLRFEGKLPRGVKETFTLINVKEETKRIQAKLEAEDKANREN